MRMCMAVLAAMCATGVQAEAEGGTCLSTAPADCQRSEIIGGNYADRSFSGGNFSGATVRDATFARSELGVTMFDGARIERVNFSGANLVGSSFSKARLSEVDFSGANLRGARFDEAVIDPAALEMAYTCMTMMPDETINNQDCM